MVTNDDGSSVIPWSPDATLQRLIDLRVSALRDEFSTEIAAGRQELERSAAARGVLGGGGFMRQVAERDATALRKLGNATVGAIVDSIVEANSGGLPSGASTWVRDRFHQAVEVLPASLARSIAHGRGSSALNAGVESALHAILMPAADAARKSLEIRLTELELRDRMKRIAAGTWTASGASSAVAVAANRDFFISHAGEDKDVAEALAKALQAGGFSVWFDGFDLKVGDRLMEKIDQGLLMSRHGVVLISEAFLAKRWPRRELAALAALEDAYETQKILPVWHGVDQKMVAAQSPTLAVIVATNTAKGLDVVVEDLARAVAI